MAKVPVTAISSLFLFIPGIYAYYHGVTDVFATSFLCTVTSVMHHGHECRDEALAKLDRICVRVISVAYVMHALFYLRPGMHVFLLVLVGITTSIMYAKFALFTESDTVHDMHVLIHACAVLGMIQYVNARIYSRF